MSLDEYQVKLIQQLKNCRDNATVRALLAEAERVVMKGMSSVMARERFWKTLEEELDAIAEGARFLSDREAGVKLTAAVLAARARISRYRAKPATSEER